MIHSGGSRVDIFMCLYLNFFKVVAIDECNETVNRIRVEVQTCCIGQHSDRFLEVLLIT